MNNKGSYRPAPEYGRQFGHRLRHIGLSMVVLAAAGCGASGGDNTTPSSLIGFPVTADSFEGAGGDGSIATAGNLAIGTTQSRTLFPAGDDDYVKVTLTQGTQYEFSANRLNYAGDTELFLYDANGTELSPDNAIGEKDDYIDLDSRILFTPTVSGTYYLKVEAAQVPDTSGDVASYILGARVFTDRDGDGYSPYYDCNDTRNDIHPWAMEIAGDGVDQDCSGSDAPIGEDTAENDDVIQAARVMAPVIHSPWEPLFERATLLANRRTLSSGDVDYFSIEIPARGLISIDFADADFDLTLIGTLYGSDGTTVLEGPEESPLFYVANIEDVPKTVYVKYEAGIGTFGYYIPFYASLGVDLDGDGYHTQEWIDSRDCDDGNSAIHPGAADTTADGVDQNCDGRDGPP